LTNSNTIPRATTSNRTRKALSIVASEVAHHDALEDVGNVLAAIGCLFKEIVNCLPPEELEQIVLLEQSCHARSKHAISIVLESVDLDRVLIDLAEVFVIAQQRHRKTNFARRRIDELSQLDSSRRWLGHLIQQQCVRRCFDVIDHVIHTSTEIVDLLTI